MFCKSLLVISALSVKFLATAQSSVPSDLSSAFDPGSISLQVSYNGQSDEGFSDGSKFNSQRKSSRSLRDGHGKLTKAKKLRIHLPSRWVTPLESTLRSSLWS